MRLAAPQTPDQEEQETTFGAPSISSVRPGQRITNHWATRNPDDFVTYPRLKPLGYLTEMKLIEQAQAGNIAARNEIWLHYARLPLAVINSLRIPEHLIEDALQEGNLGLVRAISKFEIGRLNAFSTYAWNWIYQYIQRFMQENFLFVRIPSDLYQYSFKFRREIRGCATRVCENDVCRKWSQSDPSLFHRLMRAIAVNHMVSLHEIDPSDYPVERTTEVIENDEIVSLCNRALKTLNPRQRNIIEKRYGLCDHEPMSLRQLGTELQLTKERVRQLQVKAEEKLARRFQQFRYLIVEFDETETSLDEDTSKDQPRVDEIREVENPTENLVPVGST